MIKFKRYPGQDYMKVICEVCGGEFYRKDTTLVRDKYNFQNGLVVCFKDLDEINEQSLPNHHVDKVVQRPETLSPPKPIVYSINENDDRLPEAPRIPSLQVNPITEIIDLLWQGPEDTGSSGIEQYLIERVNPPSLTEYFYTGTSSTYYADPSGDVSGIYIYRVAAINSFGTGPYSVPAYWPYLVEDTNNYFVVSPSGDYLLLDGKYLII